MIMYLKKMLFCLSLVMATACSSTEQLKVISFNLRNASDYAAKQDGDNCWMNRKEAQLKLVNEEKPDLFAVQECLLVQEEYFTKNLPNYGMIGVGRDDGDKEGEFESIYYNKERLDLEKNGNFWLSETPDVPSLGWNGWNYRMVTWGLFKIKGTDKIFYHFNTHLDNTLPARIGALKLLEEKISEIVPEGIPIVMTGDFNTCPDDEILKPLLKIVSDSRTVAPDTDNKMSFNGWDKEPHLIIDYIFESNLKPIKFRTLDGDYGVPYISDHYPICTVFEL